MKLEINDKWKWAAMDSSENWWAYEDKPYVGREEWIATGDCNLVYLIEIFNIATSCDWRDSLHRIVNGELVKHIELKVDDKVMVRNFDNVPWDKRHFSRMDEAGGIYCYKNGCTSWSSKEPPSMWEFFRFPRPEELK